jgi:molybdate/tungstate transport system substrate-binding protein
MIRFFPGDRTLPATVLVMAATAVAAAGCSSSSSSSAAATGTPAATASAKPSGTADVAYAGSLEDLNEKVIGPAFTKATGYAYSGRGAGSVGLSQEIKAGEITPNVFESIGSKPITALEPKFTSWYVRFAASPLVVAYNPASKYASEMEAIASGKKPIADLFTLLQTPGFRLGRTNPNTDPQGAAFVEMIELAQRAYGLPASAVTKILGGPAASATSSEIFSETALEPRLQAGQLDASSAFLSQAVQLHLRYIPLPAAINMGDPAEAASYAKASVTLANGTVDTGAPLTVDITAIGSTDKAAADAFIAYVLSPAGLAQAKAGGYMLLTPTAFGATSAVAAEIARELGS